MAHTGSTLILKCAECWLNRNRCYIKSKSTFLSYPSFWKRLERWHRSITLTQKMNSVERETNTKPACPHTQMSWCRFALSNGFPPIKGRLCLHHIRDIDKSWKPVQGYITSAVQFSPQTAWNTPSLLWELYITKGLHIKAATLGTTNEYMQSIVMFKTRRFPRWKRWDPPT